MLPARLQEELQELAQGGWRFSVLEEPCFVQVTFFDVPTSHLYDPPAIEIMVKVPRMYPEAGPDMFWAPPSLLLADGRPPCGADVLETHGGRLWRRFSWHRHTAWNPEFDWIGAHLEFVRQRFESP